MLVTGEWDPVFFGQIIDNEITDIVARQLVTRSRVAQTNN
jgi:hypothetical protein